MLKKFFSLFETQHQEVGVNDIVTHSLTLTDELWCELIGDVTVVVEPQYKETNIVMNICPGLLSKLNVTENALKFKSSIFQSIQDVNSEIIIDNVVYPRPTFRIQTDNLSYLFLDGLAHYTLEYTHADMELNVFLEGACDLQTNVHAYDISLFLNAIGTTKGTIHAKEVHIEHDGSGSVFLDGSAQRGNLMLDGNAEFNSSGLHINNGTLEVSNLKAVTVTMHNIQDATIPHMGNVTVYTSQPDTLKRQNFGKMNIQAIALPDMPVDYQI